MDGTGRETATLANQVRRRQHQYRGLRVETTVSRSATQHVRTYSEVDAIGRLIETGFIDAAGSAVRTKYEYDLGGQVEFVRRQSRSGVQQTDQFQYDNAGRVTERRTPAGLVYRAEYNSTDDVEYLFKSGRQVMHIEYDALGRAFRMTRPEGQTVVNYDSAPRPGGGTFLGRVASETTSSHGRPGVGRSYRYDVRGRPSGQDWLVGARSYSLDIGYDTYGRVRTVDYPMREVGTHRLRARYHYSNSDGMLYRIADDSVSSGGRVLWTVLGRDSRYNITDERSGNGIETSTTFDDFGQPTLFRSKRPSGFVFRDRSLSYYDDGNLHVRQDRIAKTSETFDHDFMNRLEGAHVVFEGGDSTSGYLFDDFGSLTHRTDSLAETPGYTSAPEQFALRYQTGPRPHGPSAVTELESPFRKLVYQYDSDGNQTRMDSVYFSVPGLPASGVPGPSRTVNYTSFSLPETVTYSSWTSGVLTSLASETLEYEYNGSDQLTAVRNPVSGDATITLDRLITHNVSSGTLDSWQFAIVGENGVVALAEAQQYQANCSFSYLHSGALDSVDATTDDLGSATAHAYSPYGELRLPTNPLRSASWLMLKFGFTSHANSQVPGLVDMGGRIYDSLSARFMSPDPLVMDVVDSQSWNAFSYVRNSPHVLVDPSGLQPTGWAPENTQYFEPRKASPTQGVPDGYALIYEKGRYEDYDPRRHGSPGSKGSSDTPSAFGEASKVPKDATPATPASGGGSNAAFIAGLVAGVSVAMAVPQLGFAGAAAIAAFDLIGAIDAYNAVFQRGFAFGRMAVGVVQIGMALGTASIGAGGGFALAGPVGAAAGAGSFSAVALAQLAAGLVNVSAAALYWQSSSSRGDLHHIMTNKNEVSSLRGGPWTPRFRDLAGGAGIDLDDEINLIRIPGHRGPHPEELHRAIYDRLFGSVEGLTPGTAPYATAFRAELTQIRIELVTVGSRLNRLVAP